MTSQIVKTARVPGEATNVYCLGPFPRRVSFTAQQNRAMNLVWALHEEGRFTSTDSIAVIGAGVAGLTAAAAFIAYGCTVDVFEAGSTSMERQRGTDHRRVHPTINQWPSVPLAITTEQPFLEWYSDTCDNIVETLSGQFEELKGANRLLTEKTVTQFSLLATELVALHVVPWEGDDPTYRLVLMAVGFGQEANHPPFKATEYWNPDGLDKDAILAQHEHVVVSGCGDGGLIDALRVAHRKFEKGRLAFIVAAALTGSDIATIIGDAEAAAHAAKNPAGLKAAYEEAARLLDSDVRFQALSEKLKKSYRRKPRIWLIDKILDNPYSLWAAPIHKFLIAHATNNGRIKFIKSEVTVRKRDKRVLIKGYDLPPEPKTKVVIRHGAKTDFGLLVSQDGLEELEKAQRESGDYFADTVRGKLPIPALLPQDEPGTKRHRELKKAPARRAIHAISQDADIQITDKGYTVQWDNEIPPDAPKSMFSVPVTNELAPSIK